MRHREEPLDHFLRLERQKLAENGYSSKGASIFITHSPCIHCALLIQKCGITDVYYHELYRSGDGLEFLRRAGIGVHQL